MHTDTNSDTVYLPIQYNGYWHQIDTITLSNTGLLRYPYIYQYQYWYDTKTNTDTWYWFNTKLQFNTVTLTCTVAFLSYIYNSVTDKVTVGVTVTVAGQS